MTIKTDKFWIKQSYDFFAVGSRTSENKMSKESLEIADDGRVHQPAFHKLLQRSFLLWSALLLLHAQHALAYARGANVEIGLHK